MKKYVKRVQPERYKFLSKEILDRFDSDEPDSIVKMAAIHKLAHDGISYQVRQEAAPPAKTLKRLNGDCTDHSILVASLYKAAGLQPALLRVEMKNHDVDHLLVEVKNPLSSVSKACNSLQRFYRNQYDMFCSEFGYEWHGRDYWFVVDTAGDENVGWSSYVGDITGHYGDSIEQSGDGDWDWYDLKKRREV